MRPCWRRSRGLKERLDGQKRSSFGGFVVFLCFSLNFYKWVLLILL